MNSIPIAQKFDRVKFSEWSTIRLLTYSLLYFSYEDYSEILFVITNFMHSLFVIISPRQTFAPYDMNKAVKTDFHCSISLSTQHIIATVTAVHIYYLCICTYVRSSVLGKRSTYYYIILIIRDFLGKYAAGMLFCSIRTSDMIIKYTGTT